MTSLKPKHYVCKRICYLTLSLLSTNVFGIHQPLVSGEDKEESRALARPAFPPNPKGVAVPGKENLTPLPKEVLCLSARSGGLRLCLGYIAQRHTGPSRLGSPTLLYCSASSAGRLTRRREEVWKQ